jgi:tRNA (cmo5U34)-methyltransferase
LKEDIKLKFGAVAGEYDQQRKSLIPCFDDFYSCIVKCLSYSSKHNNILDIGAGTGLLTSFVQREFPESHYTLIDISEEMMNQSKKRFEGYSNFDYIIEDYANYKFNEKFDVVVSALSIHHLENADKSKLYKTIFDSLESGGVFINGDQFISRSPVIEEKIHYQWKAIIENSNLSQDQIQGAFERMKMDKPATTENNIQWIEEAGFINVDLLYKYYSFGVICGSKR